MFLSVTLPLKCFSFGQEGRLNEEDGGDSDEFRVLVEARDVELRATS